MSNPFALLRSHENKPRMILWLLILPLVLAPTAGLPSAPAHRAGGEAVVHESFSTLSADPVFLSAPTYATHNYASSVSSDDFNGDGRPDVVVANGCPLYSFPDQCKAPGGVRVLLTNADGTLGAPQSFLSGGEGSQSVAVGDFNGDGKLDLAIANLCVSAIDCSRGGLSILTGKGDGSFVKAHNYRSGGHWGTALAIGDFNGDGILDLAVSDYCTTGAVFDCGTLGEVSVFLGRGDGSFKSPVSYSLKSCGPVVAVAVADLDRDGNPDLALAEACPSSEVTILLANGDGTFQPPQRYDSGASQATSVAAVDFNGDGHIDLAVTHMAANGTFSSGVVSVLLGNGDGTLQTARTYVVGQAAMSLAVADVNHDGKADLMIAVNSSPMSIVNSGQLSVLLGRGNGTFQPAKTYAPGGTRATSVVVGDFNGDGDLDVVVANQCLASSDCANTVDGALSVLLQRGRRFLAPQEYTFPDCGAEAVGVGDFNGDGNPDLAVTNLCHGTAGWQGMLSILTGKKNGTFQTGQSFPLAGRESPAIAVGDFNGDGKLDVAVADSGTVSLQPAAAVGVLMGNGDGTFQPEQHYNFPGDAGSNSLAMADFNGDGILDLAVSVAYVCSLPNNCPPSLVHLLLGNGDGTFGAGQTYVSGGFLSSAVAAGDFNRDGRPDLAVGNVCVTRLDCTYGIVRILLNNGDGTFHVEWPSAKMPAGHLVSTIVVSDFNGDGQADLAVTNQATNSGGVSVLLGNGDGTFAAAQSYASGGALAYSVAAADFNGDGTPDLLVANRSNSGLLLGNGAGSFQMAQTYNEGGPSVVAADFNHDGRPDAVLAGTIVLLNTAHFP